MDDTKQAVKVDEGKQPEEMPTSEKPAEVSVPPEEEASTAESEGLPEEASERTRKEFKKLKEHNNQMAEKLKAYEAPKTERRSAFDVFSPQQEQVVPQPKVSPQQEAEPEEGGFQPIVPDKDGYIDINELNKRESIIADRLKKLEGATRSAQEEAKRAEERIAKYEHTDKTVKVYAQHPYLDPTSDEFDEKFSSMVTKELLYQTYTEGKQDYLTAANKVKEEYYNPIQKPVAQPDLKAKENVTKRDQINAIPSLASKGENKPDQDFLVQESRKGNKDAIYQRLKQSGY